MRHWVFGPQDPGVANRELVSYPHQNHHDARQAALRGVVASADGRLLQGAPDRLRAYTRLAEASLCGQQLTLDEVLGDAYDLGDNELSQMLAQ
eukprot:7879183-Heterocapsa_arctica.AAC.1